MSNTFNRRTRDARKERRRAWLIDAQFFTSIPGANNHIGSLQAEALEGVRRMMVEAGLYSTTSEKRATRWGIRLLVSEIRGEYVAGKDQRYRS